MRHYRAVLWVSAVAAATLPATLVYGADPAPPAAQPVFSPVLESRVPVTPAQNPAPPAASTSAPATPALYLQARTSGLKFESDPSTFYALPRHDNHHYGLASGSTPAGMLNLSPSAAARTGWGFSGRVGPLRWLTPLDGEGQTKMRFGGRVPGQPRLPGMGNFNVSVHYAFE